MTNDKYATSPRNWIFVKGYGLLSLAKNMDTNIGKIISKNLIGKYENTFWSC